MGNSLPKPTTQNSHNQTQEEQNNNGIDSTTSTFTCEICIEPTLLPTKKFRNNTFCTHPFCTDCIIQYIEAKISDNVAIIKCPALDCDLLLDPFSCRALIAHQLFDKWSDLLCENTILGINHCYCPYVNCSAVVMNECGGVVKRAECPNCKRLFCFKCKIPWHAGFRCEESGELRDVNDVAFGVLAETKKWKRCPQCHQFVELIEGCNIVKCRCHTSFCYKCGRKVVRHWCNCRRSSRCCIRLLLSCSFLVYMFLITWLVGILQDIANK